MTEKDGVAVLTTGLQLYEVKTIFADSVGMAAKFALVQAVEFLS